MADFEIEGQLPKSIKYTLIVIDRVGFPIFAFCLMAYMCFITLDKVTTAVNKNTSAIVALAHKLHVKLNPVEDPQ